MNIAEQFLKSTGMERVIIVRFPVPDDLTQDQRDDLEDQFNVLGYDVEWQETEIVVSEREVE